MSLVYSTVARGPTILCSHAATGGNFDEVVRKILPNIPTRNNAKTTYTSNNYFFHVMVDNGIIYLCATDVDNGRRIPYAYLTEIKRQLTTGPVSHRVQFADEGELQAEFAPVLASEMQKCVDGEAPGGRGGDQLSVLQSQVDEVKDVMTQNIEKVLQRGENLEELMDRSTDLEAHANTFRKTSKKVHRKYFWKNIKMTLLLIAVVLIVLLVLILIILFSTGVLPVKSDSGDSGGGSGGSSTTVPGS